MTVRVYSDQAGTTAAAANDNIGKVKDLSKFDSDGVSSTTGPYLSVDANGFGSADILAQGGDVVQTFTNAISDGSALVVGTSKCIFFSHVNVEAGGTLTIGPAGDLINTNGLNLIGKVVSVATTTKVLTTAEQNSIATFFAERGASSVVVNDETVYDVNSVEADLVLDFTGDSFYRNVPHYFKLGGTYTTFAEAFIGTSPKLTYSTAAGSNSTMVNSAGELVWAPHNLVPSSNDFTTWSEQTTSGATTGLRYIQENVATGPDGQTSAHKLIESTDLDRQRIYYALSGLTANTDYTYSVFLKAGDRTEAYVRTTGTSGMLVDLSDGTFVVNGGSNHDVQHVGNGWYRCSLTVNEPGTQVIPWVNIGSGSNDIYTGDGTSGIYIWGAHVYRSDLGGMHPVPGADTGFEYYVPTSGNAEYLPRVGHHVYNGSTWVNEGLLIESEPRTNLVTYSEDFTDASWTIAGSGNGFLLSNVADQTASPDGTVNADALIEADTQTAVKQIHRSQSFAASVYTWSMFVKPINRQWAKLQIYDGTSFHSCYFDLTNQALGTATSGVTGRVIDVGNGWRHVSMSVQVSAGSGVVYLHGASADSGADNYAGEAGKGYYVYGAQLEAGSTPSSYMPTNGGTYTRTAQSLTVPPAQFGWNSDAVSIQMDGRMTYADDGTPISTDGQSGTVLPWRWWINSTNYLSSVIETEAANVGDVWFMQEIGGTSDWVRDPNDPYTPGVNVPFNISSRHGSTFINGAVDGVALTANTTPTALPDLSGTDLEIAPDFMGTIGTFRQFAGDIGDAGLEEATS